MVGGAGVGWQLGWGVLAAKGMAAWATAWRALPPPAARPVTELPHPGLAR